MKCSHLEKSVEKITNFASICSFAVEMAASLSVLVPVLPFHIPPDRHWVELHINTYVRYAVILSEIVYRGSVSIL